MPPAGAGALPRPMRLPTPTGAAVSPAAGEATPVFAAGNPASAGHVPMPAYGIASPTVSQSQQDAASQLSREQQAIILAAQKQRYENAGSPIANLIPPAPPGVAVPGDTGNNSGTRTPKPWTPPRAPSLPPLPQ